MEIVVRQAKHFFHVKSGMFFFKKRKWCLVAIGTEENHKRTQEMSD